MSEDVVEQISESQEVNTKMPEALKGAVEPKQDLSERDRIVIELTTGIKELKDLHTKPEMAKQVLEQASTNLQAVGWDRDRIMNLRVLVAGAMVGKEEAVKSVGNNKGLEQIGEANIEQNIGIVNQARTNLLKVGFDRNTITHIGALIAGSLAGEEQVIINDLTHDVKGLDKFSGRPKNEGVLVFNQASERLERGGVRRDAVESIRVLVAASVNTTLQ